MKLSAFKFVAAASPAEIESNKRVAREFGLPDISTLPKPAIPRLAIVGNGPSIRNHKHALRNWKGEVWAINNAAIWCTRHAIRNTFFTVDPGRYFEHDLEETVWRAIMATHCHPHLFGMLRNARVTTFDIEPGPGSAPTAAIVAGRIGFAELTFFGCEGSFTEESHAQGGADPGAEQKIVVKCNGERFLTRPDFVNITLALAMMVRDFPQINERSGGLLSAMVADLNYEIVGVSPALATPTTNPELIAEYRRFAA